jgi:hypothetical protein
MCFFYSHSSLAKNGSFSKEFNYGPNLSGAPDVLMYQSFYDFAEDLERLQIADEARLCCEYLSIKSTAILCFTD